MPEFQTTNEKVAYYCKENLRFLCKHVMWHNSPDKYWSGFHDELAAFLKKPSRRKLILLPRGHLKSEIVTKAWSIQQVLNNPDLRVLIANDTWDNARKYMRTIQKHLMDGSNLAAVFGRFQSEHWNQDEMTVRQRKTILDAPTWTTTGIEKEQTGQHYDLIIADDLVARENVRTPEQIAKVKLFYKDLLDLLEPLGTLVVIGTRWHQNDLYADMLDNPDVDRIVMRCYKEDGVPIFPEKFTEDYLRRLRAEKGPYEFASQYLNDCIDESAADFKASWIKRYDPTQMPRMNLYLTVDPALSLARDADYSALVVAGMTPDGKIYVVDRLRKKMVPSELIEAIFQMVDKWSLHRVGLETFAFQAVLKYNLEAEMKRRGKFFSIDEMGKRDKQEKKEERIRRLQPMFEQGLVYLRPDMQDMVDELLSFPRGKHDDLIDALSHQMRFLYPGSNNKPLSERHPNSFAAILEKTWNRGDGAAYGSYMSDLKEMRKFIAA